MRNKLLQVLGDINPDILENADKNLLEEGIIDSFDVMNIITELESLLEIVFDPKEIIADNFSCVDSIACLVERTLEG